MISRFGRIFRRFDISINFHQRAPTNITRRITKTHDSRSCEVFEGRLFGLKGVFHAIKWTILAKIAFPQSFRTQTLKYGEIQEKVSELFFREVAVVLKLNKKKLLFDFCGTFFRWPFIFFQLQVH